MGDNYGEIICTAIDEIVTNRLQGLSYDITKLCTIVDDSSRNKGKYVVSDGSVRFEAYSTVTDYANGNKVLVTIPNGDFNMLKTIIGRLTADDTTPFKYTSPIDTMIKITNNIFDIGEVEGSLLANDGTISEDAENAEITQGGTVIKIAEITKEKELSGFTRLGVTANFSSWLNEFNVKSGQYGLKMILYADGDYTKTDKEEYGGNVYELTFNCDDMYGNPYQFDAYYNQEKVFDISVMNNINRIEIYFYQDGKFTDVEDNLIPFYFEDDMFGFLKLEKNLHVADIKIYLGYAKDAFTQDTLMLFTPDLLTYHYEVEDNEKEISLRWIHKVDEGEFIMLDNDTLDPELHEIRWFRFNNASDIEDLYAGAGWELINTEAANPFLCIFNPDLENQQEEIKVVGIVKNTDTVPADGEEAAEAPGTPYYSPILLFDNLEDVPDLTTHKASTALSIECEDGSEGNYFIYDLNGKIINAGNGVGYKRSLKVLYKGSEILEYNPGNGKYECPHGKLDYIMWYIPYEKSTTQRINTMLVYDEDYYKENNGKFKNSINGQMLYSTVNMNGVEYLGIKRDTFTEGALPVQQSYAIKNQWALSNSNNTIICEISLNGVVYRAVKELRFGKAGTNGTNTTFLIEFDDGNANALVAQKGALIGVRARLYDGDGRRVDFAPDQEQYIKWSWMHSLDNDLVHMHITNKVKEDAEEEELEEETPAVVYAAAAKEYTGAKIYLESDVDIVPTNNYHILKAVYAYPGSYALEAYLPIPIKRAGKYEVDTVINGLNVHYTKDISHIEGAREVIYNHLGTPTYYTDAYILYGLNDTTKKLDAEKEANWNLEYDEDLDFKPEEGKTYPDGFGNQLTKSYIFLLKEITGRADTQKGLLAPTMYASGFNDKVCVYCNFLNLVFWSQPILIMQSRYDFAMLNAWDGTLTMDEENGTIMSTMLGAGRKNSDNTFSGVLIGDIQQGTDLEAADSKTGVYGLHEGALSFGLKEDGTAFFGKSGRGLIRIDGNTGTIKSLNYDDNKEGMMIDLNTGIVDIHGPYGNKVEYYYSLVTMNEEMFNEAKENDDIEYYYVLNDDPNQDNPTYIPLDKTKTWEEYAEIDIKNWYKKEVNITERGEVKSLVYISPFGGDEEGYEDSSYFKVLSDAGNTLINIRSGDNGYYLQSDNYNSVNSTGAYFNLNEGNLRIKSPTGMVSISGGDNDALPFFNIAIPYSDDDPGYYGDSLIYIGKNKYYLQSSEYNALELLTIEYHGKKLKVYFGTEVNFTLSSTLTEILVLDKTAYKKVDPPQTEEQYNENVKNSGIDYYYILNNDDLSNPTYHLLEKTVTWEEYSNLNIHSLYLKNKTSNTEDSGSDSGGSSYDDSSNQANVSIFNRVISNELTSEEILVAVDITGESSGSEINVNNYTIYNIEVKNNSLFLTLIEFSKMEIKYINTEGEEKTEILSKEDVKRRFIVSLRPCYIQTEDSKPKGFKLDLHNSTIHGYDLLLKGTKSDSVDGKEVFILDSGADIIPFSIGSNFSVTWDGEVTCSKVNSLNNDGNNNLAISINNNFYVTLSGGAGGSGVSFTGGFGGSFTGKGDFTKITVTDKASLPNPIHINGSAMKTRYNAFVIGISSFTGTTEQCLTSIEIEGGGGGGGIVYLDDLERDGQVTISGASAPSLKNPQYANALISAKLTLKTLGGTYLGSNSWSHSTVSANLTT